LKQPDDLSCGVAWTMLTVVNPQFGGEIGNFNTVKRTEASTPHLSA
jgi:hypothetical protein